MQNTVIQYLSHDGDIVPEDQPSYQVQQVVDKKLDMAAVWGPMAGYYKSIKKAPLVIQPVNLMDDTVPLEFDMAMATPRGRPEDQSRRREGDARQQGQDPRDPRRVRRAAGQMRRVHHRRRPAFARPVQADAAGDADRGRRRRARDEPRRISKKWLAQGADPNAELGNAVVANDIERATYLVEHGADAGARDGDGYTALGNAVRFGHAPIAKLPHRAQSRSNATDLSGWTPLMYAAWIDDAELAQLLIANGARASTSTKEANGLTPLAIATQNGKSKAAARCSSIAGADVDQPVGNGNYTPLMLATTSGSADIAQQLVGKKGANVNAKNPGGVTALMIAAAGNRTDIATLLIKAGADPNVKSEDGRTALMIARQTTATMSRVHGRGRRLQHGRSLTWAVRIRATSALDEARALVQRAVDKAEQLGLRGGIAVVGASGALITASRMDARRAGRDGAGPAPRPGSRPPSRSRAPSTCTG